MGETYRRGWHPDPYGIHAERFFYADNQPGRLVRDGNRVELYDDIPVWAEPVFVFEAPPPVPTRITSTPALVTSPLPTLPEPARADAVFEGAPVPASAGHAGMAPDVVRTMSD